jgi:hypothetical protein
MSFSDLIPLLTGGGAGIIVMALGWLLLLTRKIVLGHEYERILGELERALQQNQKLEAANDLLQASVQSEREQKAQLLSSGQLVNQLLTALFGIAQESRGSGAPAVVPPPGIPQAAVESA